MKAILRKINSGCYYADEEYTMYQSFDGFWTLYEDHNGRIIRVDGDTNIYDLVERNNLLLSDEYLRE